ncbi:MAG: FAD-dependent oxidoreductase, partial [Comamonadaceae bacterium]|nr:FAD-dependent oxidoreductase [Comamonadaceae bacterium]
AGAPHWHVLAVGHATLQAAASANGLARLLALWPMWQQSPATARPARLSLTAVLPAPPALADVQAALARQGIAMADADWPALAAQWHDLLPGLHAIPLMSGPGCGRGLGPAPVRLLLALGPPPAMLPELHGAAHGVALESGPSQPVWPPVCQPVWDKHTLQALARHCQPGTRLWARPASPALAASLAACGFVPDAAEAAEAAPGTAAAPAATATAFTARYAPRWQPRRRPPEVAAVAAPGQCLIVGAGLAAASLAYSLAVRGWQVTVLSQGAAPADGASALPAGVVAPHVSPDDRPLSRLSRAGTRATLARACALLPPGQGQGQYWAATGVLERHAPGERRLPAAWAALADEAARPATRVATPGDAPARQAALALGTLDATHPALWHARAGWLRPAALVRAMLAAPGIRWLGRQQVARLATQGARWQALDAAGAVLAEADLAVLAAGFGTQALLRASFGDTASPAAALPLHALRGQVAYGPMPPPGHAAALPPFPVNGHGSLVAHVPTADGGGLWVAGSTFERAQPQPVLRAADHAANQQRLAELLPQAAAALAPQWATLPEMTPTPAPSPALPCPPVEPRPGEAARAWAGVRCTVPDRLPLIGPLPGWVAAPSLSDEKTPPRPALSSQGAINFDESSAPLPPWVFTGLGARGLTLAVLCGDIGAAWLHDEPLPVERSLARRLLAARWAAGGPATAAGATGHAAAGAPPNATPDDTAQANAAAAATSGEAGRAAP